MGGYRRKSEKKKVITIIAIREGWLRSRRKGKYTGQGGIFLERIGNEGLSIIYQVSRLVEYAGSTQRCSSLTPLTRFHSRFEATATRRAAPRLAEPGFLAFYPGTNSAVSPGKILSYKSYAPFDKLAIQSTNESIDPTDSRGYSMARLSSLYFSPFLLRTSCALLSYTLYTYQLLPPFLIFDSN